MSSVTTKTGDKGTTDGPNGLRVPKNDPFIALVGALDEVNAQLGVACAYIDEEGLDTDIYDSGAKNAGAWIEWMQHRLLDLGAELYTGQTYITNEEVELLEKCIADFEENPGGFIIPKGKASCALHLAKAMVRRAEREGVAGQNPTNNITQEIVKFLNRMSDALYILALTVERKPHIMWVSNKKK
jgi:ATP:cob(I)alamin adenosyltransferase